MPENNTNSHITEKLTDFQGRFVEDVLSSHAKTSHVLVAQPGAGKRFTTVALISQLRHTGALNRALVLCPAALVSAWHESLQESLGQEGSVTVGRREFLELQSQKTKGDSFWPESAVIMSLDTAKREEIAQSLSTTSWGLVVVDEAHRVGGQRRRLVQSLVAGGCAGRLLLLTATPGDPWWTEMKVNTSVTDWAQDIEVWRKSQASQRITVDHEVVRYRRSDDEVAFLSALNELADEFPNNPAGRLTAEMLLRRASSSVFNLEQSLLRGLSNLQIEMDDELSLEPGHDPQVEESKAHPWQDLPDGVARTTALLEMLENVAADAKLTALQKLVNQLSSQQPDLRVCIFSSFADTATYLHSSLCELEMACHVVTGSIPMATRQEALSQFRQRGQILVGTTTCLEGFELSSVDSVIHYDLPREEEMEIRRGRYDRIGRTKACTAYAFVDESNALPFEADLLDRHGWRA